MNTKPTLYLLAYGGTIASFLNKDSTEFYSSPIISIQDLVSQVTHINEIANLHCEQVFISIRMGQGYQPKLTTQALAKAVENGCVVVRCSRTGSGCVNRDIKTDDKYGFIAGGSLSPQKARILLSVVLNYTSDKAIIQEYFNAY